MLGVYKKAFRSAEDGEKKKKKNYPVLFFALWKPVALDVLTLEGGGVRELTVFKAQQGFSHLAHTHIHTHTHYTHIPSSIHLKLLIQTHPYSTLMQGSTGQRYNASEKREEREERVTPEYQCSLPSHCRQRRRTGGGVIDHFAFFSWLESQSRPS